MKQNRMNLSIVIPLGLLAVIALTAPQQVGVLLYKVSLVGIALWLGYWADRLIFPYARPDKCGHPHQAEIRRAILIASIILAVATGL